VSPLFRRDKADSDAAQTAPEAPPVALGKGRSAGKGRPTPKRNDTVRRRVPEPPPKNNKEARLRMKESRLRMREKMRNERAERYAGARRGEDEFLMARDRGPVRRLVRDIIDSRRNVGPLFFVGLLGVVVFSSAAFRTEVRSAANLLAFVLFALQIIDLFLINRRISTLVRERFPDSKEKARSLIFYAALRSMSFRKLRNPVTLVKPGDQI
jgi:hypothetical protein